MHHVHLSTIVTLIRTIPIVIKTLAIQQLVDSEMVKRSQYPKYRRVLPRKHFMDNKINSKIVSITKTLCLLGLFI